MNRNLHNKTTINDINWFLIVENIAKGTTNKELFNALKSPYPPSSIIINSRDNSRASVFYNNIKDAIETIRANIFKKIKDKELIIHLNPNYLKKRAYKFSVFRINKTDFNNHSYGDILGIEKINERYKIDIYYQSQGEAKLAEKNAKEFSMDVFPNTKHLITDVISPFNESSQKLTNLAYAITIPVPSNPDSGNNNNNNNNSNNKSPSTKPPKSHSYIRSMNHVQKPFQNNQNFYHPYPMNGFRPMPIGPPNGFDYSMSPPINMNMNGPYLLEMEGGFMNPPFPGPFAMNQYMGPDYNSFQNNHPKRNNALGKGNSSNNKKSNTVASKPNVVNTNNKNNKNNNKNTSNVNSKNQPNSNNSNNNNNSNSNNKSNKSKKNKNKEKKDKDKNNRDESKEKNKIPVKKDNGKDNKIKENEQGKKKEVTIKNGNNKKDKSKSYGIVIEIPDTPCDYRKIIEDNIKKEDEPKQVDEAKKSGDNSKKVDDNNKKGGDNKKIHYIADPRKNEKETSSSSSSNKVIEIIDITDTTNGPNDHKRSFNDAFNSKLNDSLRKRQKKNENKDFFDKTNKKDPVNNKPNKPGSSNTKSINSNSSNNKPMNTTTNSKSVNSSNHNKSINTNSKSNKSKPINTNSSNKPVNSNSNSNNKNKKDEVYVEEEITEVQKGSIYPIHQTTTTTTTTTNTNKTTLSPTAPVKASDFKITKNNPLLLATGVVKESFSRLLNPKLQNINNHYDLIHNDQFGNEKTNNTTENDSNIKNSTTEITLSNDDSTDDSKIKIKYNLKTKKNLENDNNQLISTSYNFVKFDDVTISKYSYQYHFLYKYRCSKRCESITWGNYKDCDEYQQYKLYVDNMDYSLSVFTTNLYSVNNPAIIRQMAFDDIVDFKNINYIGDVEYDRSINHNLIYSKHSNVLLSNINNHQYYVWNLNNNNPYSIFSYDEEHSINDLKKPSLKLQYNGILRDSITVSDSSIFGLDVEGNLAKWDLDSLSSINDDICSINPQSIIKLDNVENVQKIKTFSSSNNSQEKMIAWSSNNILFYDFKNDNFKPINNITNAHRSNITTVDMNTINSYFILTGGDDGYIKVWDLRNPKIEVHATCNYSSGIYKLRWCPHMGHVFCSSSQNGVISIWSMNSLLENKPLMIHTEHQNSSPVKIDFEWNPHKDQEGTIASIDKLDMNNTKDSCVQVWRPLVYTYLYNGLIK